LPYPGPFETNVVTFPNGTAAVGRINGGYFAFRTVAAANAFAAAAAAQNPPGPEEPPFCSSPDKLYDLAKKYGCISAPGFGF
jgi:hypothetical protein